MTKTRPRNPMDGETILRIRHTAPEPTEEESRNEPDSKQLNGRDTAEHEQALVLAARRAERAEAADGILAGLIKKPKL